MTVFYTASNPLTFKSKTAKITISVARGSGGKAAPGLPTNLHVGRASSTSLAVTFNAPFDDGGSSSLSYSVEATDTATSQVIKKTGTASPIVVAGINTSDSWSVRARATGDVGSSSWTAPQTLAPLDGATQIAADHYHTCAIVSAGAVKCWGANYSGQLGNGTYIDSATPVTVAGISGATQIAVGDDHACVLIAGGVVKCWGDNFSGQLGCAQCQLGNTDNSNTPVTVGISGAMAVAAGFRHSCAIVVGGTVKCWGSNGKGQLGDGTFIDHVTPFTVTGISGAFQIVAGLDHSCAIVAGGAVKCWGDNYYGQLGSGGTTDSATPVTVTGISGATLITAGDGHSCAVVPAGAVKCWGDNSDGALGNGTTTDSTTPVTVTGISGVTAIAAGAGHSCAIVAAGAVKCWGLNLHGELGNGTNDDATTPVSVTS